VLSAQVIRVVLSVVVCSALPAGCTRVDALETRLQTARMHVEGSLYTYIRIRIYDIHIRPLSL
jgi:hypothetical protein